MPVHPIYAAAVLGGTALAAASLTAHLPVVLWNATASAPLGFYRVRPLSDPRVGDWVAWTPPRPLARWVVGRGYAPAHVPLLKQVAALQGHTVCREEASVLIDGRLAALAKARDRRGAKLPSWQGCRVLRSGEAFLLNAAADSLDGRYLGVAHVADLVGRAEPLWTWGAGR